MKSCLKATPPISPLPSAHGTPDRSENATPDITLDPPPLVKHVSFCQEGLVKCFEADDWDRTPAPVAPKLCYEEILELKQIMNSLPRAPPPPSCRPPFSTASAIPGSCTPSGFPVSRWACSPSLTPSKWKNRDDSRKVDPTILPYLDSVPIRLLPLLPPQTPPPSQCATPETCLPTPASNNAESTIAAVAASSPTKPLDFASATSSSAQPSISSPQTTPTKRKPNFTFVPLLPVKDEPSTPIVKPAVKPAVPIRKLNMTFVPLLPPTEPQAPAPQVPPISAVQPRNVESCEVVSQELSKLKADQAMSEPEALNTPPHSYIPLSLHHHAFSPTSTPSLSSASDTDTESESPSVNSPLSSSPSLPDCDLGQYLYNSGQTVVATKAGGNHNPYFPSNPPQIVSTDPGQTPPLSILFPTDIPSIVKKVHLQALPSPALIPPSPLSLNPLESDAYLKASQEGPIVLSGIMTRRPFLARPSSLSSLNVENSILSTPPASSSSGYMPSPQQETSDMTIEALRHGIEASSLGDSLLGPSLRRK